MIALAEVAAAWLLAAPLAAFGGVLMSVERLRGER